MCKLNKTEELDGEHKLKQVMQQLDQFFSARYDYHFNVLTECTEIRAKGAKDEDFIPLRQRRLNGLAIEALYADIHCMDRDVQRYFHSSMVKEYHPLTHYIDHLPKWDKRDRMATLAGHINKDPRWQHRFHSWMLGMVVQWVNPRPVHGNALMPILISQRQGLKKSTFCRLLLPEELRRYYTDEFDLNSRTNAATKLSKYALINIDEFNRMSDTKSAKLKNILQMADANYKRCGSNEYEQKQRIASFIGTSNYREILSDPTGSRRFIPAELPERIKSMRINHAQIYAQLKYEMDIGKCHWLRPAEERRLMADNAAYTKRPIEEPLFNTCFEVPGDNEEDEDIKNLSISQIYETLRKKSPSTMRDICISTFGTHLSMMGVKKYRNHVGYLYRVRKLS